jgi:hypothetical protein
VIVPYQFSDAPAVLFTGWARVGDAAKLPTVLDVEVLAGFIGSGLTAGGTGSDNPPAPRLHVFKSLYFEAHIKRRRVPQYLQYLHYSPARG